MKAKLPVEAAQSISNDISIPNAQPPHNDPKAPFNNNSLDLSN